jgi:hypothetical protein
MFLYKNGRKQGTVHPAKRSYRRTIARLSYPKRVVTHTMVQNRANPEKRILIERRAVELAKSGQCLTLAAIRSVLEFEGHDVSEVDAVFASINFRNSTLKAIRKG